MPAHKYHDKYAYFPRLINAEVKKDTQIAICIPCYNEKSILPTLQSLINCDAPPCHTEVMVLFNSSEEDGVEVRECNEMCRKEASIWIGENKSDHISFHLLKAYKLPKKIAGVGMARKTAMDEAALRFNDIDQDGILVGYDADSKCDENYLVEIWNYFQENSKSPGCSIYFEHPLFGDHFEPNIYEGIINYELHLRYYNQAFRYTGHPFAYHTVGSSFAVRSSAYQKQGGMNKRKAGEDFYFIQKIIALGNYGELNSTRVIPSPRPSDRVPFGTGRAIMKWVNKEETTYSTYDFESFVQLRLFFQLIPEFYLNRKNPEIIIEQIPDSVNRFLSTYFFEDRLKEMDKNTSNINSYTNRFYNWFNAFMVLKFVHFYRDNYGNNKSLYGEASRLAKKLTIESENSVLNLLNAYRIYEQKKTPERNSGV